MALPDPAAVAAADDADGAAHHPDAAPAHDAPAGDSSGAAPDDTPAADADCASPNHTPPSEANALPPDGAAERAPQSRLTALLTGGVVLLTLVAVGLAQTSAGRSALSGLGVYAGATPYTELYFPDPTHLRGVTGHRPTRQRVTFVLRDEEPKAEVYSWTIGTDQAPGVVSGHTVLGVHQQTTVRQTMSVACSGPRVRIDVSLTAPRESIDYWERCRGR